MSGKEKAGDLNLNAHPAAAMLRRACAAAEERRGGFVAAADAIDEIKVEADHFIDEDDIDEEDGGRGQDPAEVLEEIMATAIAGILCAKKGG